MAPSSGLLVQGESTYCLRGMKPSSFHPLCIVRKHVQLHCPLVSLLCVHVADAAEWSGCRWLDQLQESFQSSVAV